MARRLRAEGWSIKQIEQRLGVSRSSVSLWVRDIELRPEQQQILIERARLGPLASAERTIAAARARRLAFQLRGRKLVHERDSSYAAGCALYWAEGSKGRNSIHLTNSDPAVLAYFLRFLRVHFGVPDDRVSIYCNLFADHLQRQREIEDFWLRLLDLPPACLRKSQVNVYSKYSQKKRKNRLPYGTTRVSVHSTEIVQTIYGSIQELGGFDRPEWLG
jgi:transcriptional regulator with XRE-family HTH domain